MRISIEIDIAKVAHWATAIDADGVVHVDRKLLNFAGRHRGPGR